MLPPNSPAEAAMSKPSAQQTLQEHIRRAKELNISLQEYAYMPSVVFDFSQNIAASEP